MTKSMHQQGQMPGEFQYQMGGFITADANGRARPGVLPQPGGIWCRQTTTPSAGVDVSPMHAIINGTGTTPGSFLYGASQGPTVDILTERPSTGTSRIDHVGIVVDTGAGSSETTTLTSWGGTPSSSPVDPPQPPNSLPLFRITIPSGNVTTITNAMITPIWQYTALRGGTIIVANRAARDTIPSGHLVPGQQAWLMTEKRMDTWTGTAWDTPDTGWQPLPLSSAWTRYRPDWQAPEYRIRSGIVYLRGMIKPTFITAGTTWSGSTLGNDFLVLPRELRQQTINGHQLYTVRAGVVAGQVAARLAYRIETDGTHKLWLQESDGTGYTMNSGSWISLSGLSWPAG